MAAPRKKAGRPAKKAEAQPKGPPAGMPAFPDDLPGTVKYQEPLSRHSTYRIGGPASIHFLPSTPEAVAGATAWAKQHKIPVLVLGLGSNVLIRDGGFRGLVIQIGKGLDAISHRAGTWKVGAGLPTPLLARRTAEEGYAGVQRLIGVPGSVGGAVFMNAGAHGQDMASALISATVLDPKGKIVDKSRKEIPFTYRRSGLDGHIVLGCALRLEQDEPERLKTELGMLLRRRREGTPFDQPCCGSVFQNPQETTAGRLVDRCGLKGRRVGGAEISKVHANYIVNVGNASADDVLKLIDIARTAVFKEFGIELELEVKVLGEPK
jgi:UDP-N-acetylmuramate dehydrogenase